MSSQLISIRPFLGSKNFEISRNFYSDLGFKETVLSHNMSLFSRENLSFYLQDAFVEAWVNNTMIFMEVKNADVFWKELLALNLTDKYSSCRLVPVKQEGWGKECFLHDPSGILWHFGEFTIK